MVKAIVGNFIYQKGDCSLKIITCTGIELNVYVTVNAVITSKQNLHTEIENLAKVTQVD